MNLAECFKMIGGDYEGVISRLSGEERVIKYLKKFIDSPDYSLLMTAVEDKEWNEAFRLSHNIKGVCLTLGLTKLYDSSYTLCESLRDGEPKTDISGYVSKLMEDYTAAESAIKGL